MGCGLVKFCFAEVRRGVVSFGRGEVLLCLAEGGVWSSEVKVQSGTVGLRLGVLRKYR